MKRVTFIWLFILSGLLPACISLYAQPSEEKNPKIDSIHILLHNTSNGPDKFKLFGAISWEYILNAQYELALQYADSISLNAQKMGDEAGMAYSHFYYGVIARYTGEYAKALEYLHDFISYNEKAGDSSRVATGLFQTASVNTIIGDYEDALAAYYRIFDIHKKSGFSRGMAFTLNSIGVIQRKMKKYDDAIKAYRQALEIYDSLDAPRDKTDALCNLANVYADLGRNNEAMQLYHRALKIDQSTHYMHGVAYDLENIGDLYKKMSLYDSALIYQLKALKIREHLPETYEKAVSLNQTGHAYFLLKKYVEAEKYLLAGLELAGQLKSKSVLRDFYSSLASLYAGKKQFPKAYAYQRLFVQMQDSIMNEEIAGQLNELQTRYETEKKNRQIAFLAEEKKVQEIETKRQAALKKAFIGGSLLIVLLATLLIYILRQRLKNQKVLSFKNDEIRAANFKRQLIELELKALRAQINPHFIFNCMNSISLMILKGDNEKAAGYLTKFSKLIRQILENGEATEVALKDELILLKSYIQLEELRFKGKISHKIEVADEIDTEATYLPPMLLQPFVENAIWHGLMPRNGQSPGLIKIKIQKASEQLLCSIEDNGVGREKSLSLKQKAVWKSKSLGLKITEERLSLLNKELQRQFVKITDLKDVLGNASGTRVEISIPTM